MSMMTLSDQRSDPVSYRIRDGCFINAKLTTIPSPAAIAPVRKVACGPQALQISPPKRPG